MTFICSQGSDSLYSKYLHEDGGFYSLQDAQCPILTEFKYCEDVKRFVENGDYPSGDYCIIKLNDSLDLVETFKHIRINTIVDELIAI